jgi:hypothetical protein
MHIKHLSVPISSFSTEDLRLPKGNRFRVGATALARIIL